MLSRAQPVLTPTTASLSRHFNLAAGPAAGPSCRRQFTTTSTRLARTHGSSSHYDALRLSRNATKQQIKARFYELSKQHHPDAKGGDTAKFHEINDAYATLGDDSKRRQYDLSLVPAAPAHAHRPHAHSHPGSHSSFSPNDPYLHRAAQGPHRSWSAHAYRASAASGQAPRTESYTPFGRRTPPNFQYTYEYNFNYNPNARTTTRTRKRTGEEDPAHGTRTGGGGVWKFAVTVGLILVVISLGGGLTANSQHEVDWEAVLKLVDDTGAEVLGDHSGFKERNPSGTVENEGITPKSRCSYHMRGTVEAVCAPKSVECTG